MVESHPRGKSYFQQLLLYLKPHWRKVALGIGALLVVNGLGVFLPWYIKIVIDQLSGAVGESSSIGEGLSVQSGQIAFYALVVLAISTIMMGIRIASRVWMFGVGRQVEFDLKQSIFEHLLILPGSYFSQQTAGDIISRVTSDVDNIRRLLGFAILSLVNTVFAYVSTVPAMLALDARLSLLTLAIFPVMLILVKLFSGRLQQQQLKVQQELSNLSDLIQEDMNGITLIKVYAQEGHEQTEFNRRNQDLLQANLDIALTRNILFPSLVGLVGLSTLVLLGVGGPQIASGEISLGSFSALTLYVERLVFPTALLGFTITAYQRGAVSIERLEAILSVEPSIQDPPDAITLPSVEGRIEARELTFTFPGTRRPALDHINFTIEPGQMVAIVGPIGAGKSTLAETIPHLLEISPDQLWVDGFDVTRIQLQSLRRYIAYVPQESFLFNATAMDNIRYGRPDASPEEVEQAAKAAYIHGEIDKFPQQYDTLVGERGITLSGGQRQRMALARALLIDVPVLILDDSLSSVDNQTAMNILNNLSRATERKTVLFVSHRLTTAVDADQILVMDRGRIVQAGSHQDLLFDTDGLYNELWYKQKLEDALV